MTYRVIPSPHRGFEIRATLLHDSGWSFAPYRGKIRLGTFVTEAAAERRIEVDADKIYEARYLQAMLEN